MEKEASYRSAASWLDAEGKAPERLSAKEAGISSKLAMAAPKTPPQERKMMVVNVSGVCGSGVVMVLSVSGRTVGVSGHGGPVARAAMLHLIPGGCCGVLQGWKAQACPFSQPRHAGRRGIDVDPNPTLHSATQYA